MELLSPVLYVLSGVAAAAGGLHLLVGLTGERRREHLALGIMGLAGAAYIALTPGYYSASTSDDFARLIRLQMFTTPVFTVSLLWFTRFYGGGPPVQVLWALTAAFAVLPPVRLGLPYGGYFAAEPTLVEVVLPWGEVVSRFGGALAPTALANYALILCAFGLVGGQAYVLRRHGDWRKARQLAVLCGLFIGGLAHDFAVDGLGLSWIYMAEFVSAGMLLIMSQTLLVTLVRSEHTERTLTEVAELNRLLVEHIPAACWARFADGTLRWVSPGHLLGAAQPPTDDEWEALLHADDQPRLREALAALVERDEPFGLEYRIRLRGAERVVFDRVIGSTLVDGRRCHLGLVDDVTEQRQVEERRQHEERLRSLGQLAGGVAHDFNNQLMGVLGAAQLALESDELTPEAAESLRLIESAATRSAQLVRQLLDFARRGQRVNQSLDLRDVVRDSAQLLRRTLDPKVELMIRPGDEPLVVLGDPGQLQNALVNLALNARDAMEPHGGTLTIELYQREISGVWELGAQERLDPGLYAEVVVSDTGRGIAPEVMPRLFEPFFSTKPRGKGTGMGLAAVYGTARSHDGLVSASNRTGGGAEFRMLIPIRSDVRPTVTSVDDAIVPEVPAARALVIDDEPTSLFITSTMLERLGLRVTAFDSASAGLAEFVAAPDAFDLGVVDVRMPDIAGPELIRCLRAARSDLPILIVSGLAEDGIIPLTEAERTRFLQKPVTKDELRRECAALLGPV